MDKRRSEERWERTLGTEFLGPLVNQRLAPGPDRVHDVHVVLGLGGEARDGPARDDGIAGRRVGDAGEDGLAVAAA